MAAALAVVAEAKEHAHRLAAGAYATTPADLGLGLAGVCGCQQAARGQGPAVEDSDHLLHYGALYQGAILRAARPGVGSVICLLDSMGSVVP